MTRRLSDFSVLTFDCYGTLIDWEVGIWDALQPLIAAGGVAHSREDAMLAFAKHESGQQAETPEMAITLATPGTLPVMALTRSITALVRSSEAPSGSCTIARK